MTSLIGESSHAKSACFPWKSINRYKCSLMVENSDGVMVFLYNNEKENQAIKTPAKKADKQGYSYSLAFNKSGSNEIIDMIIGFINQKTKPINDTNNENENMQILDPVIQKHYDRLTKQTIEEGTHRNWIEL
ncbi:hypothetical protein GLOIN_2v1788733 [Rhizophagus irregularis DAOM 181602=DAOM 197198]|nr:hypothetical protein GLOIN_2v1788733 [Rhizophagus irregularis DAOM 181602=DAOM 197198]